MRRMILALGVFLLATMPDAGLSKTVLVKLTTQQVATVCGKQLSSGGGSCGMHESLWKISVRLRLHQGKGLHRSVRELSGNRP
jgi:hypothetical protein